MLTTTDYVVYASGGVLLILWLLFFIKGLKNAALFERLEEKEYPLKEIYHVGYTVMDTIKYSYHSAYDRKLRKEVGILYGEQYADYYVRVVYSQKLTFAFTLLVLAAPLYGLGNSLVLVMLMVMFAGLAFYYYGDTANKRIQKRSEEMLSDFSNVVSKLALLTNAGMIMREAWEEVAYTGETSIYKEMQRSVDEMKNGVSEIDALYDFGSRCVIPEIKKFSSTLIQGVTKGNRELTAMLQEQSKEIWMLKKQLVRRQGEKAASKLMLPIAIMFVGILIMIVVPIFTNLGF